MDVYFRGHGAWYSEENDGLCKCSELKIFQGTLCLNGTDTIHFEQVGNYDEVSYLIPSKTSLGCVEDNDHAIDNDWVFVIDKNKPYALKLFKFNKASTTSIIPIVPPQNENDKFKAIYHCIKKFEEEYNETPSCEQLWRILLSADLSRWDVTFEKKDKTSVKRRYRRYYPTASTADQK